MMSISLGDLQTNVHVYKSTEYAGMLICLYFIVCMFIGWSVWAFVCFFLMNV